MSTHKRQTFPWMECVEALDAFAADESIVVDEKRRWFASAEVRIQPPLVFPIAAECRSLTHYLESLPESPARHTLILLQAGAVSLGRFEDGEELQTKSLRRYVVRGRGRAQPTHLSTKGKSRYGSRLRLQNAKQLLEETSERLHDWRAEFGEPQQVYYNAPVRLWADLLSIKPAPPFERTDPLIRIPLDLPKPTTEVLLRAYRSMSYGSIERL